MLFGIFVMKMSRISGFLRAEVGHFVEPGLARTKCVYECGVKNKIKENQ